LVTSQPTARRRPSAASDRTEQTSKMFFDVMMEFRIHKFTGAVCFGRSNHDGHGIRVGAERSICLRCDSIFPLLLLRIGSCWRICLGLRDSAEQQRDQQIVVFGKQVLSG
jgi:hypothetical protein